MTISKSYVLVPSSGTDAFRTITGQFGWYAENQWSNLPDAATIGWIPNAAIITRRGDRAAYANGSGNLRYKIWNVATNAPVTLDSTPNAVGNDVHADDVNNQIVFALDASPGILVFDLNGTKNTSAPTLTFANRVRYSPDGSKLAVGRSSLTVYNTADWSTVTLTGGNISGTVTNIRWSADGSRLAVSHNAAPYFTVYDTSTWTKITLGYTFSSNPNSHKIAISDDGTKAVFFGNNNYRVYDLAGGTASQPVAGGAFSLYVIDVWFVEGGTRLLTYNYDGSSLSMLKVRNLDLTEDTSHTWNGKLATTDPYAAAFFECPQFPTISSDATNIVKDSAGNPYATDIIYVDRVNATVLYWGDSDSAGRHSWSWLSPPPEVTALFLGSDIPLENDIARRISFP